MKHERPNLPASRVVDTEPARPSDSAPLRLTQASPLRFTLQTGVPTRKLPDGTPDQR
jgi:hypothetical protein